MLECVQIYLLQNFFKKFKLYRNLFKFFKAVHLQVFSYFIQQCLRYLHQKTIVPLGQPSVSVYSILQPGQLILLKFRFFCDRLRPVMLILSNLILKKSIKVTDDIFKCNMKISRCQLRHFFHFSVFNLLPVVSTLPKISGHKSCES